jgi:hypothetical protein
MQFVSRPLLAMCIVLLLALYAWHIVYAASLTLVSDTIQWSIAATTTDHIIQFTTATAVPPSGRIVVTFEGGDFTIPGAFDYTDIDLSVSTGGPYADRTLAAAASATEDGVAISGSTDIITITLNSSTGIGAGDNVRIELELSQRLAQRVTTVS